MGAAPLSLCPMTSIFSLYQRVKPMVRPPVLAWICLPPAAARVRKAKSRSGSCETFQPLATVMVTDRPHPVRPLAVVVPGHVLDVGREPLRVHAVRRRERQVVRGRVHHRGGAEMALAARGVEQHPGRRRPGERARRRDPPGRGDLSTGPAACPGRAGVRVAAGSAGVRVTAGSEERIRPRGTAVAVAPRIRCRVQCASVRRWSAELTCSVTAAAGPVTLASSTLRPAGCAAPPVSATPIVTAAATARRWRAERPEHAEHPERRRACLIPAPSGHPDSPV